MTKNFRFTNTDSTKSDTEFDKENGESGEENGESGEENGESGEESKFFEEIANFGEVGQAIGRTDQNITDTNTIITDLEDQKVKDQNMSEGEEEMEEYEEEMEKSILGGQSHIKQLNNTLNQELIPQYEILKGDIETEYSNLIANLNATQTLADQNGQYAIGNQTLWQGAEQNYTDLHNKYQMTHEQLISFENLFNQSNSNLTQANQYLKGNQTLLNKCNNEISDLNSYLAGNQSDYTNELSSLGKKLKKEQGIINKLHTEYNITNPLSNHNVDSNKHLIEGALIGAGVTSLLFIAGALLNYKFSKKKPLFQQTIDELVDTEVLALIKFMDEKMKDVSFGFTKKVEIIKIFDSKFNPPSHYYDVNDITSRWGNLSKSFLGIYGPESGTRYSTAYKKLSEIGKSLNSFNEEGSLAESQTFDDVNLIEKKDQISIEVNFADKPVTLITPKNKVKVINYKSLIEKYKTK